MRRRRGRCSPAGEEPTAAVGHLLEGKAAVGPEAAAAGAEEALAGAEAARAALARIRN